LTSDATPQAVVIAGPNGAGKTSAAPDLLRDALGIDAFVNADVIAQGLAAFSLESAAFMAGRIMRRRLHELARSREDFAFESTLAGRSVYRLVTALVRQGTLSTSSPELAVARVRRRVEAGGHDVPEAVIRRRLWKSLLNFDRLFRPVASVWRLYDGSVLGGPLIAHGTGESTPLVLDEAKWLEIRKQIEAVG
jgi:predicted ABC-type ATPase